MDALKQWLGETFYREVTTTKTYEGYQSERISQGNYQYTTFELPFDVTVTETKQVLDVQACAAFVIVVLTFVTIVTWLRGALK